MSMISTIPGWNHQLFFNQQKTTVHSCPMGISRHAKSGLKYPPTCIYYAHEVHQYLFKILQPEHPLYRHYIIEHHQRTKEIDEAIQVVIAARIAAKEEKRRQKRRRLLEANDV